MKNHLIIKISPELEPILKSQTDALFATRIELFTALLHLLDEGKIDIEEVRNKLLNLS